MENEKKREIALMLGRLEQAILGLKNIAKGLNSTDEQDYDPFIASLQRCEASVKDADDVLASSIKKLK